MFGALTGLALSSKDLRGGSAEPDDCLFAGAKDEFISKPYSSERRTTESTPGTVKSLE